MRKFKAKVKGKSKKEEAFVSLRIAKLQVINLVSKGMAFLGKIHRMRYWGQVNSSVYGKIVNHPLPLAGYELVGKNGLMVNYYG